jgi:hypothetical protein
LTGNKEEPLDEEYFESGVHSHDDGVIHWHPQAAATGDRAKLGVFLDVYDITLTDTKLQFPEDQNDGAVYEEGVTKCGDEDGELKVLVWDRYDSTGDPATYVTNFDDIRIKNDGMAITIAFVPKGTDVPKPPSAANLPELGAADTGGVTPTTVGGTTATTTAGATTTAPSGATSTSGG